MAGVNGGATKRGRRRLVEMAGEAAIAGAFIGSVFLGLRLMDGVGAPPALKIAAAFVPVAILALWFGYYLRQLRRLDELERSIEHRSLAAALGLTVFVVTSWGLFTQLLGAPLFPAVFVAPLAAGIYGLIRAAIAWRYR